MIFLLLPSQSTALPPRLFSVQVISLIIINRLAASSESIEFDSVLTTGRRECVFPK